MFFHPPLQKKEESWFIEMLMLCYILHLNIGDWMEMVAIIELAWLNLLKCINYGPTQLKSKLVPLTSHSVLLPVPTITFNSNFQSLLSFNSCSYQKDLLLVCSQAHFFFLLECDIEGSGGSKLRGYFWSLICLDIVPFSILWRIIEGFGIMVRI